jgi:hypothetical protein
MSTGKSKKMKKIRAAIFRRSTLRAEIDALSKQRMPASFFPDTQGSFKFRIPGASARRRRPDFGTASQGQTRKTVLPTPNPVDFSQSLYTLSFFICLFSYGDVILM